MYIFERGETAEGRCKNQLRHYMIRQISSIQAYPTAGASQTSYLVFAQWPHLSATSPISTSSITLGNSQKIVRGFSTDLD